MKETNAGVANQVKGVRFTHYDTPEILHRQTACLGTSRLPDLDPAMSARLPYETQEALASILDEAVRHVEGGLPSEPDV